jgi:protein-ribulosamine 3-kinase
MHWSALEHALAGQLGGHCRLRDRQPVGGGCINQAWRLDTSRGRFFLKLNAPGRAELFAAEWDGLATLREAGAVRIPEPLARGVDGGASWLLLEYIEMTSLTETAAGRLGAQLAALHRQLAEGFGHHRDNFIGLTPQDNRSHARWADFFCERRLRPQRALAAQRQASRQFLTLIDAVIARAPSLLADHQPEASLLHGDLWSGNCAADGEGRPLLFDPAVYAGDRETDLAMSELFGRLPGAFYRVYEECWPLAPGYPERRALYNLYHILNHYNLFGGGYAGQAMALCRQLLSH